MVKNNALNKNDHLSGLAVEELGLKMILLVIYDLGDSLLWMAGVGGGEGV